MRLSIGRRGFVALAMLAALVAQLPLRVAAGALDLPGAGLSARAAEGSVWSGRLVEARVASVPLGDLRERLRPLPLLAGQARIDVTRGDDGAESATLGITRHGIALHDATLRLPVARLFAPLPIREIVLSDVTARFRDGLCETAAGVVRAEVGDLQGGMSGAPRCDAGALLLPLAGATGERLTLRLQGGGRYQAEATLRPDDPAIGARLMAAGFVRAPDGGLTLSIDGRW